MYTVSQFARRFGLSRSTLLYYDEIGLISPSARSAANYRLYSEDDLRKMERIRAFREAGLALEVIAQLLHENPGAATTALEQHLATLNAEIARLRQQQHVTARLLGGASVLQGTRARNKEQWIALLAAAGMSEDDMRRWHVEFECHFPQAHQEFLQSLGLPEAEVATIRAQSAAADAAAPAARIGCAPPTPGP